MINCVKGEVKYEEGKEPNRSVIRRSLVTFIKAFFSRDVHGSWTAVFKKVGKAECFCPKFCHIPLPLIEFLCLGVKRSQQASIAFHYTKV